jgi:arylsulfatase A-like enzyme
MAFKMQASVPGLLELDKESPATLASYGPDVNRPGSYARNCLLARRLAERGVRFIQLMHGGWDQHRNLSTQLEIQCRDTDQPTAALIHDLKQRGLLEDTLVIFAGEFGRTVFVQGDITKRDGHGRDHLGSAYSTWMVGAGVKPGIAYGETDDFSYNVVKDPVHVHDWQATILHLLGIDHQRLTYRYQGRQFRLTDVHGEVLRGLLA